MSKSYRGPFGPLTDDEERLSSRLSNHVHMLAGDIGARSLTSAPAGLEQAAAYIEHVFRSMQLTIDLQEFEVTTLTNQIKESTSDSISFVSENRRTRNVIAEIRGYASPSEVIVVGAHYDSVYDCPAANDNGSGVAAMLELARELTSASPRRTIRFVAFTNEEPPFFRTNDMGSYRYAQQCRQRGDNIIGMICLETLGFYTDAPNSQRLPNPLLHVITPTTGNFVSFVANLKSRKLLSTCLDGFRHSVQFPSEGLALPQHIKGVEFSDHQSFWQFGYPALMVTDTAFLRYPHYHEESDTPEKLSYDRFARVVAGLSGMLKRLA